MSRTARAVGSATPCCRPSPGAVAGLLAARQAGGLVVSRPGTREPVSVGALQSACRSARRRAKLAKPVTAHVPAQLRHPPPGERHGHSRHPSSARCRMDLSSTSRYAQTSCSRPRLERCRDRHDRDAEHLGQTLQHHLHVHCIVSGGGLQPDASWIDCPPGLFLPVHVMSRLYRRRSSIAGSGASRRTPAVLRHARRLVRSDRLRSSPRPAAPQPMKRLCETTAVRHLLGFR